ncbi:ribosome maturation factor RimP [Actinomyces vulturis]|uniref:ribosome maturation factor RimP n=1 Tax=Actinomyces vulturis TaxID=1857645 RepID=UPI0008296F44|nr:ribosome maturation factor RimP [Actinomyces vulturis]
MADTLSTTLTDLLAPVVEESGLFLESVTVAKAGRHSAVRVTVDLPSGTGSVDLDSIGEVSRAISKVLDEADPISGQYNLEVSSPGIPRDLTTPRHFGRAVTHPVHIKTSEDTLVGIITAADEETITIDVDGIGHTVALTDIARARQIIDTSAM